MNDFNRQIIAYIEEQIIDYDANWKEGTQKTIQVQHFSADFRYKLFTDKIS